MGDSNARNFRKAGAIAALTCLLAASPAPISTPLTGAAPAQASETIPITRALLLRLKRRSEGGRRDWRGGDLQVDAVWRELDKAVVENGERLDLELIESVRVKKRVGHYGSQETAQRILADYGDAIYAAHLATGVQTALIVTVIGIESNGQSRAVSPVGAQGLMQLMPGTAQRFGVSNAFDPAQNILGGARYLRFLMNLFQGDHVLALAAYNAGEHRIAEHKGVPPFNETRGYLIKAAAFIDDARAATRGFGARSPLPRLRPAGLTSMTADERAALAEPHVMTQSVGGFGYWLTPVN